MKTFRVWDVTLSQCYKLTYISKTGMENIEELFEDKTLLKLRVDTKKTLHTICLHHNVLYLTQSECIQRVCSDPLKKHKKPVKVL